jgi:hypothetical protein
MSEVLEEAESAEDDCEPEVYVGRGRVDAELHPKGRPALELAPELFFGDDVDGIRREKAELPVDVHDRRP